jgi:hypothetical protein
MSSSEEPKKPKSKKEPKAPKAKKIIWNVPAPRAAIRSTHWARHIYTMIKEANPDLLQRDEIRDAYNNLVNCLIAHRNSVISYSPYSYSKYHQGINYDTLQAFSSSRMISLLPEAQMNLPTAQFKSMVATIYAAYEPLYQLIKDEVVPYMAHIVTERENKSRKDNYTRSLNRLLEQQMKTIRAYQATMADMQHHIDRYTALLAELPE